MEEAQLEVRERSLISVQSLGEGSWGEKRWWRAHGVAAELAIQQTVLRVEGTGWAEREERVE